MKYQFKGHDEPFSLAKEEMAELLTDGRLLVNNKIAHASKVGDTWWIHYDGHTFQFELVEPGSSATDDDSNRARQCLARCWNCTLRLDKWLKKDRL